MGERSHLLIPKLPVSLPEFPAIQGLECSHTPTPPSPTEESASRGPQDNPGTRPWSLRLTSWSQHTQAGLVDHLLVILAVHQLTPPSNDQSGGGSKNKSGALSPLLALTQIHCASLANNFLSLGLTILNAV